MRIHHVLPSFGRVPNDPISDERSGIVHAPLSLARAQAAAGAEVWLTGWAEGEAREVRTPEGARVATHPGFRRGRFARWDVRWLAPMMLRSLLLPRPDVLSVHADPNLLRLRGRVKTLHLHTPVDGSISASYRRLLQRASAVVCCSGHVRDRFLAASGWDASRVVIIHNGVDLNRFHTAADADRKSARRGLGLDAEDFVVLYAGAVVPEKGVIHLARAMRAVTASLPHARLVVAGSSRLWGQAGGSDRDDLGYERAVGREAPESTLMLGSVSHTRMPSLMHAADTLVVPSVWDEPFGLVALEGLAAGLPVVASRAGGLPETVWDGRNGILMPPGDEQALASAILRLAGDDELRARLGAAGREQALRSGWDARAEELHAVYADCVQRKGQHRGVRSGRASR